MKNNKTEDFITKINTNVFFDEFTFSKNDFKVDNNKLELADHIVWLDDLFFIYQIKDRVTTDNGDDVKWFNNKVINKGVKQIKSTINYLDNYQSIKITNNKGHVLNISKANKDYICKIIIYTPSEDFPDEQRNLKFYNSSQIGLVHLFHSEDYYWICKYLLTPAEIEEYLIFREDLYTQQKKYIVHLSEQYVLGHFLETLETDHLEAKYINNLQNVDRDNSEFDMTAIIKNFQKNIRLSGEPSFYYPIIREIAKMKRTELKEFKLRLTKAIDQSKSDEPVYPYRIFLPRTDCGFVFIPLPKSKAHNWRIALENYTFAHKYTVRSKKCIGVIVFPYVINEENYFDMNWMYAEEDWIQDLSFEKLLDDNFPFREVKVKEIFNRYKTDINDSNIFS